MTAVLERDRPTLGQGPAGRGGRAFLARVLARPDLVAATSIAVAASALVSFNLTGAPAYQDDEGTYTAQAAAVLRGDLAPYTYWYDHPPLGWIQLAVLGALPLAIGAGTAVDALRAVIGVFFVANCVLVFLLGRRVGARLPFAVLAAVAYGASPLALELGRQVYLDSVATTWLLLAFLVALSPRRALWHHIAAGVFFAIAVLSKMTAAILGPALVVAMFDRVGWRGRAFSIVGFLSVGALLLALYPLMALLRGELVSGPGHVSLQDAVEYQFIDRSGSGWIWDPSSHRAGLVGSWIEADPILLVGGATAAIACVPSRRTRWIPLALASSMLPIVASSGYLPAMYIIGALPLLALAIGCAADFACRSAIRWLRSLGRLPHTGVMSSVAGSNAVAGMVIAAVVLLGVAPFTVHRHAALLSADANADWRRTVEWAAHEIPKDEVVLVPYSMWHDLNERGWHDPWTLIVLEKVDLDSRFALEHPGGWRDIHWVIEGPTVASNIENLGLEQAGLAVEHSEVVRSFGAWNIRRVDPSPQSVTDP